MNLYNDNKIIIYKYILISFLKISDIVYFKKKGSGLTENLWL